jgi:hypothetical protein
MKNSAYSETPYRKDGPMTKVDIAKRATSIIVGFGTGKVVSSVIQNNTDPEKAIDKVAIAAASYVLGAMLADKTKAWTDEKIDELIAWWIKNVTEKF